MDENDISRLEWITEEAGFLLEITYGLNLDDFLTDRLLQHGVVMALINIGESANSLNKKLKEKHPHIDWQGITDLRNIAAHNYGGLRMPWIWKNATRDVPDLLEQVEEILRAEGVDTEDVTSDHV